MAKRRKVGNLLALAVLAVVVQKPMHPYEMATFLRRTAKDHDMTIKWGSLYTVVRNLAKHGLLEVAGSLKEGGRPERTIYRVTEAGRAELDDWLRELVADPEREPPRFKAALSVLAVLSPDDVTALLHERLERLDAELADRRDALARSLAEVPRLFLIEEEYDLALLDAEAAWVRSFLAELEGGTLPDLELWRTFHETGQVPDEVRELADRRMRD